MLTLHNYWSSVCSQKVRLCLAEKNIPFENRHVNLFEFEHWTPQYLAMNPKAVVPALDDNGTIVIESNVIIEYLEDRFPEPRLRPRDPAAAAKMRVWLFNSEELAHENVNTCSYNARHAPRHRAKGHGKDFLRESAMRCPNPVIRNRHLRRIEVGVSPQEEEEAYQALGFLLDQMEEALKPGPWLVGEAYSLADVAMAPFINRIEVLPRPELLAAASRPRVADWWKRMQARPAYKTAFAVQNPDKSDPVAR